MPVFNGESHLRESIDSILSQTLTNFKFIVVDDGSTDGTATILRSYNDPRLTIVRHETNRGIVAALNAGVRIARSDLIARQDADDVSLAQRLERQVAYMSRHPEVDLLAAHFIKINETGTEWGKSGSLLTTDLELKWALLFGNQFTHSSVIFRRQAYERGLRYRELDVHAEDYGLWSRISRFGSMSVLPELLIKYRYSSNSITGRYNAIMSASALKISADAIQHVAQRQLGETKIRLLQMIWTADSEWLSAYYSDRHHSAEINQLRAVLKELIDGFCLSNSPSSEAGHKFRKHARLAYARRILRSASKMSGHHDRKWEANWAMFFLCWTGLVVAPELVLSGALYRTFAHLFVGTYAKGWNAAKASVPRRARQAMRRPFISRGHSTTNELQ